MISLQRSNSTNNLTSLHFKFLHITNFYLFWGIILLFSINWFDTASLMFIFRESQFGQLKIWKLPTNGFLFMSCPSSKLGPTSKFKSNFLGVDVLAFHAIIKNALYLTLMHVKSRKNTKLWNLNENSCSFAKSFQKTLPFPSSDPEKMCKNMQCEMGFARKAKPV